MLMKNRYAASMLVAGKSANKTKHKIGSTMIRAREVAIVAREAIIEKPTTFGGIAPSLVFGLRIVGKIS